MKNQLVVPEEIQDNSSEDIREVLPIWETHMQFANLFDKGLTEDSFYVKGNVYE